MMSKETFAGGCLDFCSNLTNATPQDQKDACDAGSFEACKASNTDFETNTNCKPFIDRLYGSKNNTPGIVTVSNASTYLTTISDIVDQYCRTSVRTGFCKTSYAPTYLTSGDAAKKDTYYYLLIQSILKDTSTTPRATLIDQHLSSTDFQAWRTQKVNNAITTYTTAITVVEGNILSTKIVANKDVFNFYKTDTTEQPFRSLYLLFPSLFATIDGSIKINDAVLATPDIVFLISMSTDFQTRIFDHVKLELQTRKTNFQELLAALNEFILNVKHRDATKLPSGNGFILNPKFVDLEILIGKTPDANRLNLVDGLLGPIMRRVGPNAAQGGCLIGTDQALCTSFIDVTNYDPSLRGKTVSYMLPDTSTTTTGTYEQSLLRIPTTLLPASKRDIVYDGVSILNNIVDNVIFLRANIDCATTDLLNPDTTKRDAAVTKVFGNTCRVPLDDNTIFDNTDKYNITKYCLSTGKGTSNCRNVNTGQFVPIRTTVQWFDSQTANIKDASGRTIVPICGTDKSVFNVQECQDICTTFPEVCKKDAIEKCSLPEYRFNADKTRFENKERYENCAEDDWQDEDETSFTNTCMFYILILIIIVTCISIMGSHVMPYTKKLITNQPFEAQSIYMDISNQS